MTTEEFMTSYDYSMSKEEVENLDCLIGAMTGTFERIEKYEVFLEKDGKVGVDREFLVNLHALAVAIAEATKKWEILDEDEANGYARFETK